MKRLSCADPDFEARFVPLIARAQGAEPDVAEAVRSIIAHVRRDGDAAVIDYTNRFDRVTIRLGNIQIKSEEIDEAAASIPPDLAGALALAAARIEAFHRAQMPADIAMTDETGTTLGLRWSAIDSVGIYVPGGKASYPSSVLMNALPARVAGVQRIAMCVPAPDGILNPLVLAAAKLAGVTEIYRVGGAQAVAALAYGTAIIHPVDKITGPGNAFVAEAKRQVFGKVGIDSIAGPSEVLIIADGANNPDHIALDLIAQAEHGEDSQCMLITDDKGLADQVAKSIETLLAGLERGTIAAASLAAHGAIILVKTWAEAANLANRIAPEHLQLMLAAPDELFGKVRHAGAVFLGRNCPTAIGDYIAGPNHTLPTSGTARFASGLSVFDFLKRSSYVAVTDDSVRAIGPAAVALARSESLTAHAASIAARLGNQGPKT
jgi:histidinol dehydrogenase